MLRTLAEIARAGPNSLPALAVNHLGDRPTLTPTARMSPCPSTLGVAATIVARGEGRGAQIAVNEPGIDEAIGRLRSLALEELLLPPTASAALSRSRWVLMNSRAARTRQDFLLGPTTAALERPY